MTAQTTANCPTFLDLKAFSLDLPAGGSDDPLGRGARILPVRAGDCEVFVSSVAASEGLHREERGDTWVMVLEGGLRFLSADGEIDLVEGESLVIARGAQVGWRASVPVKLVGMRYLAAPDGDAGVYRIDNGAPLAPSNPPGDDVLLGEKPSCRSGNQFTSADAVFKCGVWDSTPYRRLPIHFHHSELMHLLAGSVTFTDASGRTASFGKGDTFIIEKGADCSWDSRDYVAKVYAYYRP